MGSERERIDRIERSVSEEVAYLRGLMAGSGFLAQDEGGRRVWESLLGIIERLAADVERLRHAHSELEEYVEAIDADLGELEDDHYDEASDAAQDDDEFVEMTCPQCGRDVTFEAEFLDDDAVEISCPDCGTLLVGGEAANEAPEPSRDGERRVVVELEQPGREGG